MLTYSTLPAKLKSNFDKNITCSVAFVKDDGTVRHMAFRKTLKAYQHSTAPKTDAQMNVNINNNLLNVVDTNAYIIALKDNNNNPVVASRKAYRKMRLDRVIAFMTGGEFFDMTDVNEIPEELKDQITKNMAKVKSALQTDISNTPEDLPVLPEEEKTFDEIFESIRQMKKLIEF